MRYLLFVAAFLMGSVAASAQDPIPEPLTITAEVKSAIKAEFPDVVGDWIFYQGATAPKLVGVLKVETEASRVTVEVENEKREPVDFEKIGSSYIISKPGKVWIEVTAIDFAKNIFDRQKLVIEIGKAPIPPPEDEDETKPAPIQSDIAWVVFVEESANTTPEIRNLKFSSRWGELKSPYRWYDIDEAPAKGYREFLNTNKIEIPAMILLGRPENGLNPILGAVELPKTMQEILDYGNQTKPQKRW